MKFLRPLFALLTVFVLVAFGMPVKAKNAVEQTIVSDTVLRQLELTEPVEPTPHPILNDVLVRRAISYCADKDALLASVYPDLTAQQRQALIADTFIPAASWAYTPPSVVYPFDPASGQTLLDQAGWVLPVGSQYRMRDGRELALTVTSTDADFRVTYLTVFEAQMRACGIRTIRNHMPASWWFGTGTGLAVRDFEMGNFAWVIMADDPGGRTIFACDHIPAATNGWQGQNYPGWCNLVATDALIQATNPDLPLDTRRANYAIVSNELATDLPVLPLFWRANDDGTPSELWEHIDINLETYLQEVTVEPTSASVLYYTDHSGNQGSIALPTGAVTETITLSYAPLMAPAYDPSTGRATAIPFRLTAIRQGVPQSTIAFSEPITVTVPYAEQNLQAVLEESSLDLFLWDGAAWQPAVQSCPPGQQYQWLDMENNVLTARICHLSEFALMGANFDYNSDGTVDVEDIIIIAGLWGQEAGAPYDQDGDGWITIVDIQRVARWWGWTAP